MTDNHLRGFVQIAIIVLGGLRQRLIQIPRLLENVMTQLPRLPENVMTQMRHRLENVMTQMRHLRENVMTQMRHHLESVEVQVYIIKAVCSVVKQQTLSCNVTFCVGEPFEF